jgi:hypothetical protein
MGLDSAYGIGSLKTGVCTSTTRPAAPFDGQTIYETDTDKVATYDLSSWIYKTSTSLPHAFSTGVCSGSSSGVSVTFPVSRFSVAPIVTCMRSTARGGFQNVESITSAGFTVYSYDYAGNGNSVANINWIAIQMTSASAAG